MSQPGSSPFPGGTLYRETIRQPAFGERKYIRRFDERGYFAHIALHIEPAPGLPCTVIRAEDLPFPQECYHAARLALLRKLEKGPISGYPMLGIRVSVIGGSYLIAYSSPEAFSFAACMALDQALQQASPMLVEPWVLALLKVEHHALDRVLCELIRILGALTMSLSRGDYFEISVEVPHRILPLLRARFGLRHIETRTIPIERQYRERAALTVADSDASGLEDWT